MQGPTISTTPLRDFRKLALVDVGIWGGLSSPRTKAAVLGAAVPATLDPARTRTNLGPFGDNWNGRC